MSAAPLPVNCPAPIATLSPRGSLPSVIFSMPRGVILSMPIDTRIIQSSFASHRSS